MSEPVKSLSVPPDVLEHGGSEVFRAFVSNGGLSVSFIRGFDDPAMWGMLLADVVRHLNRTYALEDGLSEEDVQARIVSMMAAELDRPTDLGTTSTIHN